MSTVPGLGTPIPFRTLEEARELAGTLATVAPEPGRVELGLTELMLNAVEHGNLEIGNRFKAELQRAERWEEEIARRLATPPYDRRTASVAVHSEPRGITYTIRDEGRGFDPEPYFTPDPARMAEPNGRGIFLANSLAFDQLVYAEGGTRVTATVLRGGG